MLADTLTVLLVPAPGDDQLLRDGPAGARVPKMRQHPDRPHERKYVWDHTDDCYDECQCDGSRRREVCANCGKPWPCALSGVVEPGAWGEDSPAWAPGPHTTRALVLALDGRRVGPGCDRALDALAGILLPERPGLCAHGHLFLCGGGKAGEWGVRNGYGGDEFVVHVGYPEWDYSPDAYVAWALGTALVRYGEPGARVVLLRDGLEVPS